MVLLLTLLVILMGCDNGSVSDSAAEKSSGLVKVCLNVDGDSEMSQKALWVDNYVGASLKYQYNAVPQWDTTGAAVSIQGATDWKAINYSDNMSLGYFTPGQWVFGVRILLHDNNEETEDTVIYEGFSSVISVANRSVEVTVEVHKLTTGASAGAVSINVTAPTIDAANDYLTVSYSANASITINAQSGAEHYSVNNGITTYKYTFNNLSAGEYDFTLRHSSGGIGGAVAVELRSGEMAVISGYLESGTWQLGSLVVPVYAVGINKNAYGNVRLNTTVAVVGDTVSFELDPLSGSRVTAYSVTRDDNGDEVTCIPNGGSLYSFIMPDADVTVNATFAAVNTDIDIDDFNFYFLKLYKKYKNTVHSFGRSDNPPLVEFKAIQDVKIWYDDGKIYWHSANNNIMKFAAGSMEGFFKDSVLLNIDLRGIDTSAVTSMAHLFDNCEKLRTVNLTGLNTTKVTDMSYMFNYAGHENIPRTAKWGHTTHNGKGLVVTGLDSLDTTNVKNMSHMFYTCSIDTLSVASFDVGNVRDFSYMFSGESKNNYADFWYNIFPSLDVAGWNVGEKVPASENGNPVYINMEHMFDMCNELTSLAMTDDPDDANAGWDFTRVNNMASMFNRCEAATSLIFPKHTVLTNVTDMLSLFCRIRYLPLNGDGGWKDIFSRWDISGNTSINFTASSSVHGSGDSPNRVIQNDAQDLKSAIQQFDSYNSNIKIKIGGNNLGSVENQRLEKVVIQNQE